MESLRMAVAKNNSEDAKIFDFDPKHIDWEDYFSNIHIPGVLKYVCDWNLDSFILPSLYVRVYDLFL